MPTEHTADILSRLRQDDRSALQWIFENHYEMVAKAIYRVTQDVDLSKDLAQEVFIRFWKKRHTIEIKSSLPAYLRRMAINEGIAHQRSKKNHYQEDFVLEDLVETTPGAESQYLYSELSDKIMQAIGELPPKCKMIFQMSRFDDMTYKEIADTLELSPKTVENQMGKALKHLRIALHQYL